MKKIWPALLCMGLLAAIAISFAIQAEKYKRQYQQAVLESASKEEIQINNEVEDIPQSKGGENVEKITEQDELDNIEKEMCDFIQLYYNYSSNPYERYVATKKYMTENALENFYKLDDNEMDLNDLEEMLKEVSQGDEQGDIVCNSDISEMRIAVQMQDSDKAIVIIHGKTHIYNDDMGLNNYTDFIFDADIKKVDDKWLINKIETLG